MPVEELTEVYFEKVGSFYSPPFSDWIENNDVTSEEFLDDPKAILPHFMVSGHPLSIKLLEEEKISKSLLGE